MKTSEVTRCEGPIDRVALLQMIHGPECNIEHLENDSAGLWSDDPFPLQSVPKVHSNGSPFTDFTGFIHGRCKVIGYFAAVLRNGAGAASKKRKGKFRHYWVLKCQCGSYQLVNGRKIGKQPPDFTCLRCHKIKRISSGNA